VWGWRCFSCRINTSRLFIFSFEEWRAKGSDQKKAGKRLGFRTAEPGPERAGIGHGLRVIDTVHGVPKVLKGALSDFTVGTHTAGDRGEYNPVTKTASIKKGNPSPARTTVHEVGHHIDLQLAYGRGYASVKKDKKSPR
jgi:hypothetical protein